MNKAVTMTFRVEEDLRSQFSQAAELEHRPAAQVLREFMREYVQRVSASQARRHTPINTAEQRLERKEAIDYARASINLEGFKLTPADEEHAQRFMRGEIDLAQFVKGPSR